MALCQNIINVEKCTNLTVVPIFYTQIYVGNSIQSNNLIVQPLGKSFAFEVSVCLKYNFVFNVVTGSNLSSKIRQMPGFLNIAQVVKVVFCLYVN